MNNTAFYFIIGVSGVGKTSVISYLKTLLSDDYEVHDFDERGVPAGADHNWRIEETKKWIAVGKEFVDKGKNFIVCGFANPDEIEVLKTDFPTVKVEIILLDGEDDVIEQRLRERNKNKEAEVDLERVIGSVEDFIQNNRKFTPVLREMCKKHKCSIIDTTYIKPEKVAEEIVDLIK